MWNEHRRFVGERTIFSCSQQIGNILYIAVSLSQQKSYILDPLNRFLSRNSLFVFISFRFVVNGVHSLLDLLRRAERHDTRGPKKRNKFIY